MGFNISPDYITYVSEDTIIFVCGCNVVLYNFNTKKQTFLIRKNNHRQITHISVGKAKDKSNNFVSFNAANSNLSKDLIFSNEANEKLNNSKTEILICIAEYSEQEELFYISIIKPFSNKNQYIIKSTEKIWKINFSTILNNSPYCVVISQKKSNSIKTPILSRISFVKYPLETFISQENITEEITYCCYNPKNTIKLIICGKGYFRLWDVFVNEGTLKEHQQRFLRGKQEKEKTFLKVEFFEKKPNLLIAGTKENVFYIFENFLLIHELNVCYSYENIYDLNIQNFNKTEENDNISIISESIESLEKNHKDLDSKLKAISNELANSISTKKNVNENTDNSESDESSKPKVSEISEKEKIIQKLYKPKGDEEENEKLVKNNGVKYFELINDNLLFVVYIKDGCTLFYKFEWNRKMDDEETEIDFFKWKADESRIIRIAKNIKTVHGFSIYKPTNDIIIIGEAYENNLPNSKKRKTYLSLYKFKKLLIKEQKNFSHSLKFEYELFKGFFLKLTIKFIDIFEKKNLIYFIDKNNILYCFNILQNKYILTQHLNEEVFSLSVNQLNNNIAISFKNKVSIYRLLKAICQKLTDIEISDSIVKWLSNGKYLIIAGKNINPQKKLYCVYFLDYLNFNTVDLIENVASKITKISLFDNDRYVFFSLDDSLICGFCLNMENYSFILHEILIEETSPITIRHFPLMLKYPFSNKNYRFNVFDYDSKLHLLVCIDISANKMFLAKTDNVVEKKKKKKEIEIPDCNLLSIKLIRELNVLVGGDNTGALKIYNWPFKGYNDFDEPINLNENLKTYIHLDLGSISTMINYRNYTNFLTLSNDSCLIINSLLIKKENSYKQFEYFDKKLKPQIEMFMPVYDLYDINKEEIISKEKGSLALDEGMEKLTNIMNNDIKEIEEKNNLEYEMMENTITQNTKNEITKYESLDEEIKSVRKSMNIDLMKRIDEMKEAQLRYSKKYKEKLGLYDTEIKRLKNELRNIRKNLENLYNEEVDNQKKHYSDLSNEYNPKFNSLEKDINDSLLNLVKLNCEYDEAGDTIAEDYKKLSLLLANKIQKTKQNNENVLNEKTKILEKEEKLEAEHKKQLEKKVKDSDKLIEKNIEIKQSIINATQRTITFQEQLLETEKNIVKIDKKLEDLVIKNKHLEQIRFVLEHRMTSIEKEKTPLEGQCAFLENQKNKLTTEFNKIILEINKNNQELENKQSQLRASLIQNYEIHDQKNYIESKIMQFKKDIQNFLVQNIIDAKEPSNINDINDIKDIDEFFRLNLNTDSSNINDKKSYINYDDKEPLVINDKQNSRIALKFKDLYDKYFNVSIDDELMEYQFFTQKLEEEKDKEGIAKNHDLLMRNKAEEKLITEKKKVEELKVVKEKGYNKLHNENTILINECNRLRKNLHEIYLHVIDIENRFIELTNINPNKTDKSDFSKSLIVKQIKEFIRQTHEKIKLNFESQKINEKLKSRHLNLSTIIEENAPKKTNKRYITPSTSMKNLNLIKSNKTKNTIMKENSWVNKEENKDIKIENKVNYYADLIKIPKKLKKSESVIIKDKNYNVNPLDYSVNNNNNNNLIRKNKIKLVPIIGKK